MHPPSASPPPHTRHGQNALARGAWEEAAGSFETAISTDPADAGAWDGLATASLWLEDTSRTIEAREQAHRLYLEGGDLRSAARVALDLAGDFLELRGEPAVANGWFQRGRRLLRDLPPGPEHALLHLWDAYFALEGALDPEAGRRYAEQAVQIAERTGAPDLAMLGRALTGLSRVVAGEVERGMSLLDEAVAAAVGGDSTDPDLICRTCCCMIDACEQVRDYGRAVEWCDRLREVSRRWRVRSFLATCRIKYSGVLLWRGDWDEAEAELSTACEELARTRPSGAGAALVRLAEVRRRQGRIEEAEALLHSAGMHPGVLLVRAAVALDAGEAETALDLLDGHLRRVPEGARTERVPTLELVVRAALAIGLPDRAARALTELEETAARLGTEPVRAAALAACGVAASAEGDLKRARTCFEDAAHLFERSGSPYECARTRTLLAGVLAGLNLEHQSRSEASAALAVLEPMGAAPAAAEARALAGDWQPPASGLLTPRQREVLALAAEGMTDREIAERLSISEYTVHRHMSDVFARLGVSTRTGAVARALREGLL
jgi:LuxR family transcriptional regulator, maltose regulon positive regulatory protein